MRETAGKKGFTFLEMMMIMVAIGAAAMVIAPAISSLVERYVVLTEGELLKAKLRYTQQSAISSQLTYAVQFTSTAYTISYDSDNNGSLDTVEETRQMPSGLFFQSVDWATSSPPNTVFFNYLGSASEYGEAHIENAKGDRLAVRLWGPSGHVMIQWM